MNKYKIQTTEYGSKLLYSLRDYIIMYDIQCIGRIEEYCHNQKYEEY